MNSELDELYLTWLYSQVASVKLKNPSRTFWSLLKILYNKEFVWIVANDDNRVEDGKDLRYEFIDAERLEDVDLEWINLGCSMLEMLISLSRRLSFETDKRARGWFWHLMDNLGLEIYNDRVNIPRDEVEEILNRVIWRTYAPDGSGGLFPLQWPKKDQRDVEIWYQMCSYLIEREEI